MTYEHSWGAINSVPLFSITFAGRSFNFEEFFLALYTRQTICQHLRAPGFSLFVPPATFSAVCLSLQQQPFVFNNILASFIQFLRIIFCFPPASDYLSVSPSSSIQPFRPPGHTPGERPVSRKGAKDAKDAKKRNDLHFASLGVLCASL